MFTVKFTFSEPFAIIVPVTPSHLHILILLVLVIMGGYSNHLYLDKMFNSLIGAVVGIAAVGVVGVVGVAVVTHRSSLFSVTVCVKN